MSDIGNRIKLRRLELGMSRADVAAAVGCKVAAIQALEQGADLDNWPLRLVKQLRSTLALTWSALDLEPEPPATQSNGPARLGAELVRSGRLRQMDVAAAELLDDLPELKRRLGQVGLTCAESVDGTSHLVALDDVEPIPRILKDVSDRIARGALNESEHSVIDDILQRQLDPQRLSRSKSRALASLLRAGLIAEDEALGYAPAGPLEQALGASPAVDE